MGAGVGGRRGVRGWSARSDRVLEHRRRQRRSAQSGDAAAREHPSVPAAGGGSPHGPRADSDSDFGSGRARAGSQLPAGGGHPQRDVPRGRGADGGYAAQTAQRGGGGGCAAGLREAQGSGLGKTRQREVAGFPASQGPRFRKGAGRGGPQNRSDLEAARGDPTSHLVRLPAKRSECEPVHRVASGWTHPRAASSGSPSDCRLQTARHNPVFFTCKPSGAPPTPPRPPLPCKQMFVRSLVFQRCGFAERLRTLQAFQVPACPLGFELVPPSQDTVKMPRGDQEP